MTLKIVHAFLEMDVILTDPKVASKFYYYCLILMRTKVEEVFINAIDERIFSIGIILLELIKSTVHCQIDGFLESKLKLFIHNQ